jgi:hypothetical protein
MDLISYGDGIPEGDYRLHSAFSNAINFSKGRLLVSLVPPRTGAGPLNVVLKQLPAGANRLRSTRSCFYIDENRLRKEPSAAYCSGVPRLTHASPETVLGSTHAFTRLLVRRAPPKSLAFIFDPALEKDFSRVFERHLLARFKKAVSHFRSGDYKRGAGTIRGLGFGLTPSGDDFISGLLAGWHFAQASLRLRTRDRREQVYGSAEGGNLVSNAFIRASYEGRVNAKVRRLMLALAGTDRSELASAAKAALSSGHTSGSDLCSGLAFSLLDVLSKDGI